MPFILGVTGGIASGKSTATDIFESLGISVVDADKISRELVAANSPALEKIITHFGRQLLLPSGELNRPLLREYIFTDPEKKDWLENLLHPMIRQEIIKRLQQLTSPYGILSSPLLFETQQHRLSQRTLVIDCSEQRQQERALKRDKLDTIQIKRIMASQLSRLERLQHADDVISNNGSLDDLKIAIRRYHEQLLLSINPSL